MPSSEVMHKFAHGKLHSGSKQGPEVTNRKQAIAIMLSEKKAEQAHGGHYPEKRQSGGQIGGYGIAPGVMPMQPPQGVVGQMPNMPNFNQFMPRDPQLMQRMEAIQHGMRGGDDRWRQGGFGGGMPPPQGMPQGVAPPMPAPPMPQAPMAGGGWQAPPSPGVAMPTAPMGAPTAAPNVTAGTIGVPQVGQQRALGGVTNLGVGPYNMAKAPTLKPPPMVQAAEKSVMHGPVMSAVSGRTDAHKTAVPSGSYVVPADVVSGRGQGNTLAGMNILQKMFKMGPYGAGQGAPRPGRPSFPSPAKAPKLMGIPSASGGGKTGGHVGKPVPVHLAGGELVVPPANLMQTVHPHLETAHRIMDKWVVNERKKHIKTLSKLPGPVKD